MRTAAQAARERKGLSIDQVAKKARLHPRYVRRLELHGRAPLYTAERLATICGCDVTEYLYPRAAADGEPTS